MIIEDENIARSERILNIISVLLIMIGLIVVYKKI
jgi:predicted RND superfamily exporter protein